MHQFHYISMWTIVLCLKYAKRMIYHHLLISCTRYNYIQINKRKNKISKVWSFIQESIEIVVEWTTNNDVIIHSDKSKEMIINYSRDGNFRNQVSNITIENDIVEQVGHVKLLRS